MTYASGGIIAAADFNDLRSNGSRIIDHFSTGSTRWGLGQSSPSVTSVSSGSTITATQWTNLITAINKVLVHQGDAAFSPASVATGGIITYYSTLAAKSSLAYTNAGTTAGLARSDATVVNTDYASTWGQNAGNDTLTFSNTVTFADGNSARYFFNGGGLIKMTFSRNGAAAHTRDTEFSTLCTDCGTVTLGYRNTTKVGGGGATPSTLLNTDNGGYWAGTGSPVVHFQQLDNVGNYSASYIKVSYHWTGIAQNGGSPVLNLTTEMFSTLVGETDSITGTTRVGIVVTSPSTAQIANTWGTPTIGGSGAVS
jgi:hypothetical protein